MRSNNYQEKLVICITHANMRMQFSLDPSLREGARSGARTGLRIYMLFQQTYSRVLVKIAFIILHLKQIIQLVNITGSNKVKNSFLCHYNANQFPSARPTLQRSILKR